MDDGGLQPPAATRAVLLTRFNLPSAGRESLIRAQEGWLQERIGLFERFAVPSVRRQDHPVSWLVYLDPESPAWLLEKMADLRGDLALVAVLRTSVSRQDLVADLRQHAGVGAGDRLVTMNLDNDDGLADDVVARMCAADPGQGRPTALYVVNGLVRNRDRLYLRTDSANAFCAVAEPGFEPVTCWADWHNLLGQSMPQIEIDGPPGWLQVVHGRNVSNRVRGTLTDPGKHRTHFGDLLDDLPVPGRLTLARDAFLSRPTRAVREGSRQMLKGAAFRVLGKDNFDTMKARVALTISRVHKRMR